jgi:DNA-binding CsgD family transcriptional regulator
MLCKLSVSTSFLSLLIFGCLLPRKAEGQYEISGQLNNYNSLWLNEISVSAINSTGLLYDSDYDLIINKDTLDKKGFFTLKGNNLPDERRIYRIDLTNQKHATMIQRGINSNFIFLILNNHSTIKITSPDFSHSPFDYKVEGSGENSALQQFEIFLDRLQKLFINQQTRTGTGKDYTQSRFNTDIRNYCDTCRWPVVALMAISEITDFDKDYTVHPAYYRHFLDRVKALAEPNSVYVKEFETKLSLHDFQNHSSTTQGGYLSMVIISTEGLIILFLLILVWRLKSKARQPHSSPDKSPEPKREELYETLTRREKEILTLLIEDKQNKEIASALNLEVSTIKTHIGKIYQKLNISNRNEVKTFDSFLKHKNGRGVDL